MKKIMLLGFAFILLVVSGGAALFIQQFSGHELARFSASVGNTEDCETGGSFKSKVTGDFFWWYLNLPGVSASFTAADNHFLSAAFEAITCQQGQPGYEENSSRIKRLVLHGLKQGEAINNPGDNGFNLLHGAVIKSDLGLAHFLLQHGADPASVTDENAVWKYRLYKQKNAYELALALRANNWEVHDAIFELLKPEK